MILFLPQPQRQPHNFQPRSEFLSVIQELINTYFNQAYLTDRLQELPQQFTHRRNQPFD
jgi:hypothetical protein